MENKRGLFIVMEGVDGCGKSTQSSMLASYLRSLGRKVHLTCEPTESGLGGMIRDSLGGEFHRTNEELAAMFVADRVYHNVSAKNGIKMHLEEGTDVVCDRYYYSSLAYQGLDGNFEWVAEMNLDCPSIEKPDICIFIDLDPEKCLEHIRAGRTHFEIFEKNSDIIAANRNRYLKVFKQLEEKEHIVIVDGSKSIDEVFEDIKKEIDKLI